MGTAVGGQCFDPAELNLRMEQSFQLLALNSDARFMARVRSHPLVLAQTQEPEFGAHRPLSL